MTQALPHIGNVVVFDATSGDNWSQTPRHDDDGSTATTVVTEANSLHHHHHHHHHHQQQQQQSQVLSPTINSTSKSITTPSVSLGGDTVFNSSSTITNNTSNSSTSNSRSTGGGIYTYTTSSNLTNISSIPLSSSSSSSSFFATVSLPNSGPCSTIESPTVTTGSVITTSIGYTATLPQTTTASHPQGDPLTSHTGHRLLLLLQQQQQQQQQQLTTTTSNIPLTSSLLLSTSPPTTTRKNKDNPNASNNTLTLTPNPNNLLKSNSGLVLSSLSSSGSPGKKSDNVVTTTCTTSTTTATTLATTTNSNIPKSSPGLGLSSSSSSSSPSSSSFLSSHSSSCSFTSSSSLRITKSPSTIVTCPTGIHLPSSPRTDTIRKFRGLAGSRGPCSSSGGEATTTTTTATTHPSSGEENYPRISATPEDGKERLASIEENIESSISAKARAKISNILQEVNQLSDVEKLLLYLKLPTGATSDDPLTLSPTSSLHASSRVEQTQAYTWIKSHLEEDSDICLPKQEVYEEYRNYCESLNLRRLSTADFGKIMKCVFPNIKPRRLGQRGQSKYVYSGIRKKLEVQPPVLPELEISPRKLREDDCYGRDELFSASCQLVCEWAEKLLERAFSGLRELSEFLVSNSYVNSKSMAAFTVSAAMQEAGILNSSAAMSSLFSSASGGDKHRETQLQLQRKLQEREMLKEQKRRLHQQKQENEHDTKSPHRTRNESHTPGLPSPKTKFLSPSSCLRFRSSSSLENLLMPTAVSDNKSHIKDQVSVPTSGRARVMSGGNKPPVVSQDVSTSAAHMKICSARSLFQDKSSDRQCVQSEGSETRVPSRGVTKDTGSGMTDTRHSKTPELSNFHSLKKPSVIPVLSWADEKTLSTQQTNTTGPSNLSAMLSTSVQTSADNLHKPQLLTDINQNVSSDSSQSEKTVSCSTGSSAFMLNKVLEKTSRVGTVVPLVSQPGSAKSAFVPFSQMHMQNIAETKTTQSTDYLPTSSQKNSDHSSEPSILAQMLECNDNSSTLASPNSSGNYIQVPTLKSGWESEGGTPVSSTECVTQTSPSVAKRSRSRFAPIRPKAMQAKTILSLLQEQSGSNLDSTPYDRRRVATILKEKHAHEQTETTNQSRSSTPLPVTATATATVATSAFGSVPTATEVVAFPMNPVVSKPNELFIILGSPATGTVSAAGNVFLPPSQNSSNMSAGTTLAPQQATAAGTAIFQTIPSVNGSVGSQTEMVLSNTANGANVNPSTTGETLAWKTFQLDPNTLPHIAIPSQQIFTSLNPQQEAGSTSSLGIAVPLSGGLVSTSDPQECTVDPSTQFMISKNIQLDGALLSGFNFNLADPSQSAHTISVSSLLPTDLATSQVTVKMETAEPDNSLLMTTGQLPKRLSEESTSSILQQQQSTEIVNSTTSIGKFVFTNFGAPVSGICNEGPQMSAGGEDNSQPEVKEEKSEPPTKPASLLRPLLNSDLNPGEFTKTKILNELLSTEDSLLENSLSNENDSFEKPKLEAIDKSNIDNHSKNEPKNWCANSGKIMLPVQMPVPIASDSVSTSVAVKTGKASRRSRAKSSASASRLHLRTLSLDASPAANSTANPNPVSGINVQPTSHINTIAVVGAERFARAQQNVTVSPCISSTSDLNASLLTDTVVTYSSRILSSHTSGDMLEPSSSEDKNPESSPSFSIVDTKEKANQLLRDLGVTSKLETDKSPPEIHPTSRKRKSSEKSSGSNSKRKLQSNKTTTVSVGQLDSSIATSSPSVSSGQEWLTIGMNITENPESVNSCLSAEPLQSPDISSVEKDALLDSAPQILGLELSNAGSMLCMTTNKMSSHSQTMSSGHDNKTPPSSNLSSSQQFDRQISDLLNLAQPLSIEGMSPASSISDSASISHSQLSLQGLPYSQLSPQQVNMATELAVFKRSVTDSVAAFLQPTDQKNGPTSQGAAVNTTTQKCQFSQETQSLLQKHLTNMIDTPLTDPHVEQPQQQCVKSSFLCEMLQPSDLGSKKQDFLEEEPELPSDVADFITESMTSNQNESVFPSGSAGSSTNTSNLQPFPDLKLDVEDLLNQATPSSSTAVPPPVGTAADLGANVCVPEKNLKRAAKSISILGEAETRNTLNSTQNRPFREDLENSNTFAIPDAQAVVRKGGEVKQGRFSASATSSHPLQLQPSSLQATTTNESAVFRMSGQAPEFVAPNVTIPQRWHTLSYEKTGSHTPVSDSGYSSASPIRSTPPTVPFSFGSSAENLVNNVISQLEHRSASCEPPTQSPLAEPIQTYNSVATHQASNVSAGPSPTSLPPSPQTFTPIHGSSLSGTTYDPPPIRPTATVANKTLSKPQINQSAVTSSQQPSRINKENNRELLNLLQSKSPPSYENAIRMLSQKSPRSVAASSQLTQRSPGPVVTNISDTQPQPQPVPSTATKPRTKARSRSTSNTATKGRRKRSIKESGCVETKAQNPQLVRCLSDSSAMPSSVITTATEASQPEADQNSDKNKPSAATAADGPPSKTKKSVQISPAYPFSYKLSLLKDRSAVGGQVIATGDHPVVSVEHPPTTSQASFVKLTVSGKVKQEEGLGSGTSVGGGSSNVGGSSNQSVTTSRSQSVPLQNVTTAATQPKAAGQQQKKSTHISDLPNVNYMGNAPNVDLGRVFWEKLLTTPKTCTQGVSQGVTVMNVSSKMGNNEGTSSVNVVAAPPPPPTTKASSKRNLIQLLEDRTSNAEEVEEFKSNLDELLGMHCLTTTGDFQTLVGTESLNQSLLVTPVQPSSVCSTQSSSAMATSITSTTTAPTKTVPSSTVITSSSNSSVLEEELTAGAYKGQRLLNHSMSFSPHSMQ